MSSLLGKNINETYEGLLKTFDNNELQGGAITRITDGLGTCTALSLGTSSNTSIFHGSLIASNTLEACQEITANNNICVKGNAIVDTNLTVAGDTITNGITGSDFLFTGSGVFNNLIRFNSAVSICGVSNIRDTNIIGNLNVTGNINSTGDVTAFTSSDNRLKENLIPIDSSNYINNLTGYEFDWNSRSKRTGKGKGIIAQDLYNIDDSLVRENGDGYLTVDYTSLIPVLIEEVKRLGKEIEELKKV